MPKAILYISMIPDINLQHGNKAKKENKNEYCKIKKKIR